MEAEGREVTRKFDHVAYQKRRRDKARAEGKCVQCCTRPRVAGKSRCDDCLDSHAAWQQRQLGHAEGGRHCTLCNERGHDVRRCPSTAERYVAPPQGEWCDECLASGFHRAECKLARRGA